MNLQIEEYLHIFSQIIKEALNFMPFGREFIEAKGSNEELKKREVYRVGRFKQGLKILRIVENYFFKLDQKNVLDIGCGFGGHLAAFMTRGVFCVGCDFVDYRYKALQDSLNNGPSKSSCHFVISDMNWLPLKPRSFDLIFSNGGIEHLPKIEYFLEEIRRLLRDNGIAIIGLPVALQGVLRDPHYKLPFVSIFPAQLKGRISERLFKKSYPWKVYHTFLCFSTLKRQLSKQGLDAKSLIMEESRKFKLVSKLPFKLFWIKLLEEFYWDWIIIRHEIT